MISLSLFYIKRCSPLTFCVCLSYMCNCAIWGKITLLWIFIPIHRNVLSKKKCLIKVLTWADVLPLSRLIVKTVSLCFLDGLFVCGRQDAPLNDSPAHCRALCEQLEVQYLAQGYLSSALKVFWHTFQVFPTLGLEPRTLSFSAQHDRMSYPTGYYLYFSSLTYQTVC